MKSHKSPYVCSHLNLLTKDNVLTYIDELLSFKCQLKIAPVLIGSRALHVYDSTYRHNEFTNHEIKKDYDLIVDLDTAKDLVTKSSSATGRVCFLPCPQPDTHLVIIPHLTILMGIQGHHYELDVVVNRHQSGYLIASRRTKIRTVIPPLFSVGVVSLGILEAIKTSHIYHPHQFTKHITDLHRIRYVLYLEAHPTLKFSDLNQSAEVPNRLSYLTEIIDRRRWETDKKKSVPAGNISLMTTNDDFLEKEGNLTLQKFVKHDDIHEMVMFGKAPLYTKLKHDQSQAMCLQSLWDQLTLTEQLQDVMEEAMVLALERYLFTGFETDEQRAYELALTRVCTTITKGWFREFAVNHYPDICKCPKPLKIMSDQIIQQFQIQLSNEQKSEPIQLSTKPEFESEPIQLSTKPEFESETIQLSTKSELEHDSESDSKQKSETESESESKQKSETESESESETESESKHKSETESDNDYGCYSAGDRFAESDYGNYSAEDRFVDNDYGNYSGCDF